MTTTRATLVPHPTTPCAAVESLGAQVTLTASGRLEVRWVLLGDQSALLVPAPAPQRFRDGLWKHTCFECFIAADGAARYVELNVAPSREWAAYAFVNYREGMAKLDQVVPRIEVRKDERRLDVHAGLELASLIEPPWSALKVGLTAVVETAAGTHSYWALRHPTERPDFHHRGGMMLSLA